MLSGVHRQQILGTSDLWVLVVTLAEVPHKLSLPCDLSDHQLASRGHSSMDPVRQQTTVQFIHDLAELSAQACTGCQCLKLG